MLISQSKPSQRIVTLSIGGVLLFAVVMEASLMGDGRLAQLGPLTLKMWLYAFAQIYVLCRVFYGAKLRTSSVLLVGTFVSLLLLGTILALGQLLDVPAIGGSLSPLLYMPMLLFFELTLCDWGRVRLVSRVFEGAASFMGLVYLVVLTLLFTGVLPFLTLFRILVAMKGEFIAHGTDGWVLYKGTLYIGVGAFFLMFEKGKLSKVLAVIAVLAVMSSATRGYFLGLAGAGLVHVFTGKFSLKTRIVILACTTVLLVGFLSQVRVYDSGAQSEHERLTTLQQINERITPVSLFLGHGLGVGVPEREGHMEIAYAEIFQNQGLLGLSWWVFVLALVGWRYKRAVGRNYELAQPILLAVVFDAIEAATNPTISNPIGMLVLLFALASLPVLERESNPMLLVEA